MTRPSFFFAVGLVACTALACSSTTNKAAQGENGESSSPTSPRESEPCQPGNITLPIDAFDVTPSADVGLACDVGSVLDEDGSVAGLARPGAGTHKLANHDVTGCVGVEFGENITLSSLIMKMRPVSGICGHSCTKGVDDGCGTGWKIGIFVGQSLDKLEYLQQLSLTTQDPFEYRVAVLASYKARFAVVCREGTPATGDDVAIDAISGLCGAPPKKK